MANNGELSQWDYASIKKELASKQYTKCNTGRTDNTISLKSNDVLGKRVKVISIFADMVINKIIPDIAKEDAEKLIQNKFNTTITLITRITEGIS